MSQKQSVDLNVIDDDDRFLIRSLYKKNQDLPSIAKRLGHEEQLIDAVIKEFENNAGKHFRAKQIKEATFFFYQHKNWVLFGQPYAKYTHVLKKCEKKFPQFGDFLDDLKKNGTLKDSTTWSEVEKIWDNKNKTNEGELGEVQYEAKCYKKGGKAISIDVEERHMDAVCKIKNDDGTISGCGSLVDICGIKGIMTNYDVLSSVEQCDQAEAIFDKVDGTDVVIQLKPMDYFLTDPTLRTTFVACDMDAAKAAEILPLEDLGDVEAECPIYSYFHVKGTHKVQFQQKVKSVKSNNIGYDGEILDGSVGAPVYCEDKLVGISHGTKNKDSGVNTAIGIRAIGEWVKRGCDIIFLPGEEVRATWSDNHKYNARISYKTERGYMVDYYEFGEQQDLIIDKIEKLGSQLTELRVSAAPVYKKKESIITTTTKATTTTTTTITTTTPDTESKFSKESRAIVTDSSGSLAQLDEDDRSLIMSMVEIGRDPATIAKKLHQPLELIEEFLNHQKNSSKGLQDLVKFLKMNGVEKYEKQFLEHGYDALDKLIAWKQGEINDKLLAIGCKPGAAAKIEKSLRALAAYVPDTQSSGGNVRSAKTSVPRNVLSIKNVPMHEEWRPGKDDYDFSEEFLKPDGNSSIRYACQKLNSGYNPKEISPEVTQCIFYINSTRHKRFFKMEIIWK